MNEWKNWGIKLGCWISALIQCCLAEIHPFIHSLVEGREGISDREYSMCKGPAVERNNEQIAGNGAELQSTSWEKGVMEMKRQANGSSHVSVRSILNFIHAAWEGEPSTFSLDSENQSYILLSTWTWLCAIPLTSFAWRSFSKSLLPRQMIWYLEL